MYPGMKVQISQNNLTLCDNEISKIDKYTCICAVPHNLSKIYLMQ